ncbi:uncharacterized protein LOC129762317 isoform X2 [Toxorhynchites rutilus septentrionalis]|uniref:uncharacterized protein LOC129762317 isoform X2 n=1 Tax=Toxorhynchites rutilus septentrionalis TaxID=329112 RepID=UPI00247ADDAE|nr:uncharacterized protein LOC129762317 isoform X2 [Toxorhynchites rutilus septentrionalis]
MNKSWKRFDMLTPTPIRTRKDIRRHNSENKVFRSSRKTVNHIKRINSRKALFNSHQGTPFGEESKIEDASDEDTPRESIVGNVLLHFSEYKEVLNYESDIEDVSENDDFDRNENIDETDGSDCESIHCKRINISRLDFINSRSPGSARKLSDDLFMVSTVTDSKVDREHSSTIIKPINATEATHETPNAVSMGARNNWNMLNNTFNTDKSLRSVRNNFSSRSWKEFDESFEPISSEEVDCADTETSTILSNTEENTIIENIPDDDFSYIESNATCKFLHIQHSVRLKCIKNSPLNCLRNALHWKMSRRAFWLHERQMGLVAVI